MLWFVLFTNTGAGGHVRFSFIFTHGWTIGQKGSNLFCTFFTDRCRECLLMAANSSGMNDNSFSDVILNYYLTDTGCAHFRAFVCKFRLTMKYKVYNHTYNASIAIVARQGIQFATKLLNPTICSLCFLFFLFNTNRIN